MLLKNEARRGRRLQPLGCSRGGKNTISHSDYIIPLLEFCVKCFVFVTEGELERDGVWACLSEIVLENAYTAPTANLGPFF